MDDDSSANPVPHGTAVGYNRYRCRCDECKAAKAHAARASRARTQHAIKARRRRYYAANRDVILAKNRQWVADNPERDRTVRAARETRPENRARRSVYGRGWYEENRDRVTARCREYARANPEVYRASARRYREAHPERVAEIGRAWAQRNPGKVVAKSAQRRARCRQNETLVILPREWPRLCARYGNRCAYCGGLGSLSRDHIVPVVRGGRDSIGNLLPACKPCNSRKRHRLIIEWRAAQLAAGRDWRPLWLAS